MTSILSLHDNIVSESYSFGFMFLCMHNVRRENAYQIMPFYKKLVCRKDYFRYAIVGYRTNPGTICTRISDFKIEQLNECVIGPVKKKQVGFFFSKYCQKVRM